MNVLVLMENTARAGLACEHGLSLLLEHPQATILLDAGSSGSFADNASAMGVDLSNVDFAVLSHGHYDHADGLRRFFRLNDHAQVYVRPQAGGSYFSTSLGSPRFIGIHRDIWEGERSRFCLTDGLTQLREGIWLVPQSVWDPRFTSRETNLLRKVDRDQFVPDDFSHEQSLVCRTPRGLAVFNSCSHGGIVNIVKSVLQQLPGERVYAVIGGLHMISNGPTGLNCPEDYVRDVARELRALGVEEVYTGHCTGQAAATLLEEELGEHLHLLTAGAWFEL